MKKLNFKKLNIQKVMASIVLGSIFGLWLFLTWKIVLIFSAITLLVVIIWKSLNVFLDD